MDVALFNNQAYVTEYLAEDSTIAVFNTSDLSSAGIITPTNPTGPSGLDATFSPTAPDSGFSDIDIGTNGQIYVAEQLYNSSTDYTPPGGTEITGQTFYFDRIMVSSARSRRADDHERGQHDVHGGHGRQLHRHHHRGNNSELDRIRRVAQWRDLRGQR